jgi:hypothetical protein
MPSPFPGMDPWLERPRIYADLRFTLVVRLSHALNAALPEGVRLDDRAHHGRNRFDGRGIVREGDRATR